MKFINDLSTTHNVGTGHEDDNRDCQRLGAALAAPCTALPQGQGGAVSHYPQDFLKMWWVTSDSGSRAVLPRENVSVFNSMRINLLDSENKIQRLDHRKYEPK